MTSQAAPPPAEPEIHFARQNGVLTITLDRPRALNALSLHMIRSMDAALAEAAGDPAIACVLIEGTGGRAFCAGGDIRSVGQALRAGDQDFGVAMFRGEYSLNHRIRSFPKPFIALVDGIVMGGGVGVSIHGSHRIMSERASFAMPETGIGLFPDVGMTYLLPRAPGELGLYAGLTGARLATADAKFIGFATHVVPSGRFDELRAALIARAPREKQEVDALLAGFATRLGPAELAVRHRPVIDRCFAAASMERILAALDTDGSAWAESTAAGLRSRSPTSLKLTLRAFRAGRALSFEACLATEFRMSIHCLAAHDLTEGVRALLIDKDMTPHWRPATLDAVDDSDIDGYFAPLAVPDLACANGVV